MKETIMGISIFDVRSIDEYWLRLEKNLENYLEHFLHDKHEFGTSHMCSEGGIQTSLAYSAQKIAQEQGFDTHKTKCICLAVGLCFPDFGSYGMAACENYFMRNNIPWNSTEIKIGAIELCITESGGVVTPQLDEALHAYYENRTDIPEVNVARYCQIKIKESRELMKTGMFVREAISKVMDCTEKCFSVEESIMISNDTDIDVPIEVQEKINAGLDVFIKYSGLPRGILEFIIWYLATDR